MPLNQTVAIVAHAKDVQRFNIDMGFEKPSVETRPVLYNPAGGIVAHQ